MNKKQVQKRVLLNGEPLAMSKFSWDESTNTFSSNENGLVLDFNGINGCTFKTGCDCTFKTGSYCTFKTESYCTFTTESSCTFNTRSYCTFKTGKDCTFHTSSSCTFNTGCDCTFNTRSYCTFNTGWDCVIVRRDIFKIIQPNSNQKIQLCPYGIKGYVSDGIYSETGKQAIIADGILSNIISKKESVSGTIYRVINHGESNKSYLLEIDGTYAHGTTLKDTKDSFKYKISNRDTSQYKDLTLDSVITLEQAIKMYRCITGACESGTRYFVEQQAKLPSKLTVQRVIELTKGQWNNESLVEFFKPLILVKQFT